MRLRLFVICQEVSKLKVNERYGAQIIDYRGVCNVELEQGESRIDYRGYFEAAQFSAGQISVGVIPVGRPRESNFKVEISPEYQLTFTGEDFEGWTVESIGRPFPDSVLPLLVPLFARPTEVSFGTQYMVATRQGESLCGYSKARFLVSNLLWHDRLREEIEPIGLDCQDFQLYVTAVDGYRDVSERLTHAGGVEPTAWVTIENTRGQTRTLKEFQDLMDDAVFVFRLVTGNRVDWYYGEGLGDSAEEASVRIHKYSTREPYSSTLQFQHRDSGEYYPYGTQKLDLSALVDAFFDSSRHVLDTRDLRKMIDQYTSACRDTTFLESSGLLASTLTELIVAKWTEANGNSNLMRPRDYSSQVLPLLRTAIESANLQDADKLLLKEFLIGGYRRSFRSKLNAFRDEFQLPLTDDGIDRIVRTRNSLVHEGTYRSDLEDGGWYNDYEFMIWTNLISLSRLLGYTGDLPQYQEGAPIRV